VIGEEFEVVLLVEAVRAAVAGAVRAVPNNVTAMRSSELAWSNMVPPESSKHLPPVVGLFESWCRCPSVAHEVEQPGIGLHSCVATEVLGWARTGPL
jgi:hypothetical protein